MIRAGATQWCSEFSLNYLIFFVPSTDFEQQLADIPGYKERPYNEGRK